MTRKADEARIRQEMAAAIAAYTGPVTKCPPGKARGGIGKVKLLIRPRYTPPKGTTQASNPQIPREAVAIRGNLEPPSPALG